MSNKFTVILDDEDADLLKSLARIFSAFQATGVEQENKNLGETATGETPTRTRRSRADAGAASSTTEPASDAGASDGRRRRRTSEPEPAPAAEEPARRSRRSVESDKAEEVKAEEPVRRRRTAPAVEGISDAEVAKAASQAAQKLTPALVMQIMKEDHGVTLANDIPQDQRQKFLDTLKAEMAD